MTPRSIKLLVGALLVTAPLVVGIGAVDEDVSLSVFETRSSDARGDGEVVETFEGEVDASVTTGELDLRVDHGSVRVVGWEEDRYEVRVLQTPRNDDETNVAFEDNSQADHLNLSVTVDRDGNTGARINAGPADHGEGVTDKAIVAHVPARLTYESIHACEGEASSTSNTIHDALDRVPTVASGDEHDVCVPANEGLSSGAHLTVGTREEPDQLDVAGGFLNLQGVDLDVRSDDHDVELDEIDFERAHLIADDGTVNGTNVTTSSLALATDDGDVSLAGATGDAEVHSDDGDVALDATMGDLNLSTDDGDATLRGQAGAIQLASDDGDLDVHGVDAESIAITTDDGDVQGDDVTASRLSIHTDDGDADLGGALGDVDATSDDGDLLLSGTLDAANLASDDGKVYVVGTVTDGDVSTGDGDVVLDLTPRESGELAIDTNDGDVTVAVPEGPAHGYDVVAGTEDGNVTIDLDETEAQQEQTDADEREHERTRDFEQREIQVHLTTTTNGGDVWVTDHDADLSDAKDGDDEAESDSESSTSLVDDAVGVR